MRRALFAIAIALFAIALVLVVFMAIAVDEINWFSAIFHVEGIIMAASVLVAIFLALLAFMCLALSLALERIERLERGSLEN